MLHCSQAPDLVAMASDKGDTTEFHEKLEALDHVATYIEPDEAAVLPEEHRQYLLKRHSTLKLDSMPGLAMPIPTTGHDGK
jgi:hypothetical protein